MRFLLKRRLNPFLLLTTIVGLSLLAGLSIIYQSQFGEVTEEQQSLKEELAETEAELNATKTNLSNIDSREAELMNRTSELEEQLANKSQSTEELQQTIDGLQQEVQNLEEEKNELVTISSNLRNGLRTVCDEENLSNNTYPQCDIEGSYKPIP